jgi:hypothetical protein
VDWFKQSSIRLRPVGGLLFGGVVGLSGEHPRFGAATATAFLAANLLHGCTFGGHG